MIVMRKESKQWDDDTYKLHANKVFKIAKQIANKQGVEFVVDDNNKHVLRFLTLYFNGQEKALEVFPDEEYSLSKNILLCGGVGAGKTMMMEIMAEYLKSTQNHRRFENISVTKVINHYKAKGNIDKFTFNEAQSTKFEGDPYHICLNDIGLDTHKHYGTDTLKIIEELMYARNEIFTDIYNPKYYHLTTNLGVDELCGVFDDEFGRIPDRLKTYNVIPLLGNSRR